MLVWAKFLTSRLHIWRHKLDVSYYKQGFPYRNSGGSRGVSAVSIETPFEPAQLAKRLTVSLQLEAVKTAAPLSLHLCACASKGGVVATVHMHMKLPFPNPGSATEKLQPCYNQIAQPCYTTLLHGCNNHGQNYTRYRVLQNLCNKIPPASLKLL